ncbi:MAG: hypothetical protein ACOVQI_12875 [Tagaea sp.]
MTDGLRYAASRHRFAADAVFGLGEDYRLAHLPLVVPGHPRAISSVPGKDYRDGRYATSRHALVLHIPADALEASPLYRALDADLRARLVASKIAWHIPPRRRSVLHATLAGPVAEATGRAYEAAARTFLARSGPIPIRLGGPFVGDRNHGRIYLPVRPVAGNPLADLQRAIGARETGFYAVGHWCLTDDLTAAEAAALAAWRDRWENETVLEIPAARFGILITTDDQAIHSPVWRWIDSGARG